MANDDRNSGPDDEGVFLSLPIMLAFLMRNSLTLALVFLLFLPILDLLPEDLYDFTLDHPFLLFGPLLVVVPVILAYFVNWDEIMARKNIVMLVGALIFGLLSLGAILLFGIMMARFICPDGYPFTDFPKKTPRPGPSRGEYLTMLCLGKSGVHEIPARIVEWAAYGAFLFSGLLSVGVSFVFGRQSRLFGRGKDAGELHFVRYFLIAITLSMGFLSLPEIYSGGNILAGVFESSGKRRPLREGKEFGQVSPIHGAVLSGKLARVKTLLKEGAAVNAVINHALTPLAVAVKKKNQGMVRMLVEAGADVNLGEKSGYSAMQYAIRGNDQELIAYLLKQGGNPGSWRKRGFKALFSAVKKLDLEAARKLLEDGANPNTRTKYEGKSLLFQTIFEVNTAGYKRPRGDQIKSMEMARLLLKHGAKPESRARYRHTPLVYAIQLNNIFMVKLFLERGAKVNAPDKDGRNSLYHALRGSFFREEILALLVEKGVKVNNRDKSGQTALITLAQYERGTWPLQWLLSNGADVNLVDKAGQTALDKLGRGYYEDKKRKVLLEGGAKSALTR